MRALALVALVAVLAGCRSSSTVEAPSPSAIYGRIESAQGVAKGASVHVYRVDEFGLATPDPFETVTPDRLGKFTTRVLAPGRYRVVLRSLEGPPSIVSAKVPGDVQVVLRPLVQPGLVGLRVRGASADPTRCRLTESKPPDDVPDVREFTCSSLEPAFLSGLRPGGWSLDVPELGATTEIDLARGSDLREMLVDPPALAAGGTVSGMVRRVDGSPAAWMVVSARPLRPSSGSAERWGRYCTTDRSGAYRIVGIPPGKAFVRIECREVAVRILPAPLLATIPPSGAVSFGFIVEP